MRKAHQTLTQGLQGYSAAFDEMDKLIKEGNSIRSQSKDMASAANTYLAKDTQDALNSMINFGGAIEQSNENTRWLLLVGSVLGVLLGLAFAFWIILGVIRVLTRVSSFASEIAHGNFTVQLAVKEGGVIGSMVESMRIIPDTLNKMIAEYSRIEQQVEHGDINVHGDAAVFSGGFRTLIEGTNNILQRFGIILNNVPSPLIMFNQELRANYMNKAGQAFAGSDYMNKTCGQLFHREDDGTPACALTKAVKNGEVQSAETVAHPGGKRLDISYTVVPMKDASGRLASVMQFIVDLTHIRANTL